MSQASLAADLKSSLHDAAQYFTASGLADFKRHLDLAAGDFARVRARRVRASFTLVADQLEYNCPGAAQRVLRCDWGRAPNRLRRPWEPNYLSDLPDLSIADSDGTKTLILSRPVSALEIADVGADCVYYYSAAHRIDADAANTTIDAADRGLLLLRAQAEACQELALRQIGKPVSLRDGLNGTPRNATPAALADYLLKLFEARA